MLFLREIELKTFRCFEQKKLRFHKKISLIIGDNGTGKSSLIEAIHYLCYMKSFRNAQSIDLIERTSQSFFLKAHMESDNDEHHAIQVGYAAKQKMIKVNNQNIKSYKELFSMFQVITLHEEDIHMVKGSPAERRTFLDNAALLLSSQYIDTYRAFKKILQQRNALLSAPYQQPLEMDIWTERLFKASREIQALRADILKLVEQKIQDLITRYFHAVYTVTFAYEAVAIEPDEKWDTFILKNQPLFEREKLTRRSLFGAHLDNFTIMINGAPARFFASRGQQKLIALLCKLALIPLAAQKAFNPVLLVDDFIADFDAVRLKELISFFADCQNQIIITTPLYDAELQKIMQSVDPDVISMNQDLTIEKILKKI